VGEMRVSRVLLFLTLEGAKLTYPANGYSTMVKHCNEMELPMNR
jgi:hypothetical protein